MRVGVLYLVMATKEEIAKELNETIGADLEFERLRKPELMEFKRMVDSGELAMTLAKQHAKETASEKVEESMDDWEPGTVIAKLL